MLVSKMDNTKAPLELSGNFAEVVAQIRVEVDAFCIDFHDDPKFGSRWGHHYFCAEDGAVLIFDRTKPHEHQCSLCGKVYQSKLLDSSWWTMYRNEAITTAWKSAYVFSATGDVKYLENVKSIIAFYADHYLEFGLSTKEGKSFDSLSNAAWGCGRIMPQGLNEAIILIRILNALQLVKGDLPASFLEDISRKLFLPAFDLLRPQVDRMNNIACWVNCAIGAMGLFSANQEMITFVFEGERNIRRQLREGVTEAGFWYEGSIHYNYFTLEGLLNLLYFAKVYGFDFGIEKEIVRKMLHSAYEFAFDNGQFPNPNDGWPNLNLKSFSYLYALATTVFDDNQEMAVLLADILAGDKERGIIPLSKPYYLHNQLSLNKLLFAPDLKPAINQDKKSVSRNYPSSNCCVVCNEQFEVFHKYGHQGPAHAHPDKMTVEVIVRGHSLSRDLSNSGYGSRLCNEWHRVSAAHNTVVVDGENHVSMGPGKVEGFQSNQVKTSVDDVYPGVHYFRAIQLDGNQFYDCFTVESTQSHTCDYFFHVEAELLTEMNGVSDSLGYALNGYQHIKDLTRLDVEEAVVELDWRLGEMRLRSQIELDEGQQLYVARTFGNPASEFRRTLIIRQIDCRAEFKMKWTVLE